MLHIDWSEFTFEMIDINTTVALPQLFLLLEEDVVVLVVIGAEILILLLLGFGERKALLRHIFQHSRALFRLRLRLPVLDFLFYGVLETWLITSIVLKVLGDCCVRF